MPIKFFWKFLIIFLLALAIMLWRAESAAKPAADAHANLPEIPTDIINPEPPPKAPDLETSLKRYEPVDAGRLQSYLEALGSPLAAYAPQIAKSEFSGTIIGICWVEQYRCTKAPSYNFWGLMRPGGGLQRFQTMEESIAAINAYLARLYDQRGRTTIESLRGYYCVNTNYPGNICPGWETNVLKVKAEVENLTPY